jgi:bifunctional non-homologous end joining protein LigD
MKHYFDHLTSDERKKIKKEPMPSFVPLMLATLTDKYFSHPNWIFERKFDGIRCLVIKKGKKVTLKSRNNNIINVQYPELVQEFENLDLPDCILDGEIVAFQGKQTSFSKLQKRFGLISAEDARATGFKVYAYLFDILYIDGYNVTKLPLLSRKKLLKNLIPFKKHIRYSTHRAQAGEEIHKQACKKGWEGVLAKKSDSIYEHKRSSAWLKFKCVNEQELVIAGYTDPQGSRIGFGSLLMGYYKNGQLHYAGNVGTGFDDETLQQLHKKLKKLEIQKNPFVNGEFVQKRTHFVKPQLVAQIGFTEWTKGNKLRHPRFLGLRYDKPAKEVVKEG